MGASCSGDGCNDPRPELAAGYPVPQLRLLKAPFFELRPGVREQRLPPIVFCRPSSKLLLDSPRLYPCRCEPQNRRGFSPWRSYCMSAPPPNRCIPFQPLVLSKRVFQLAAGAPDRGNIFGSAAVLLFAGCSLCAVFIQ
jgi:hypothetical protein